MDIKKGDVYLCNCDIADDNGTIIYNRDKLYLSEKDGYLTNNKNENCCFVSFFEDDFTLMYRAKEQCDSQKFRDIANELADLYEKKNSDYGNSFGKSIEKYGKIAALTRISDKFNRLESLMSGKEQKVDDEKLEDTLKDMASYCIMTLIELDK